MGPQESPSADAVRRQLERVLASAAFARSARMSRFLRLAVEHALAGRGEDLKEYLIGVEVFDRREAFDPRYDPIVRVEARRLRAKLRAYYEGAGGADELVIEVPTGSYAPLFRRRASMPAPEPQPAARWRGTIAVLPFTNLGPDMGSEYFSDGLTEELIHHLTRVPGLRVVAWSTASQLKGRADVRAVAEQLQVATVLTGSVRKSGNRVRVTAQLIDTADGAYLWSEAYDREMRDLFAIQEEISWAIVNALRLRLTEGAGAPRLGRLLYNVEAYDLYLKGRFHWNLRSADGLRRSAQYFEEAIARDPDFALGYAGLADALCILVEYGLASPAEGIARAQEAALKALERDPLQAEAMTSLAFIRSVYEWNWAEGERYYRRAIELNPGYATAHHWYAADFLAPLSRWEKAEAEIETARQLDPLSPIIAEGASFVHLLRGDYERAAEGYRELMVLYPAYYRAYTALGRALSLMGRYGEAIAMLEKGRAMGGDVPSIIAARGQVYGQAGREADARRLLAELTTLGGRAYVSSASYAILHLGLGEPGRALEWLEAGCRRRDPAISLLGVHPVYDSLRPDPRFQALLKALGLAPG